MAALAAAAFALWWRDRPVKAGPGVLAPDPPVQQPTDAAPFTVGEYRLTPLARFSLQARVLGKERYYLDRGADLAPVDLALGWGPMSDGEVLRHLRISQSRRHYRWHTERFPVPRPEIEAGSANMHIIPADPAIAAAVKRARAGQVIRLDGLLVEASAPDGWTQRSSLVRTDTGDGSCEVVYVKSFDVVR